MARQTNRVMWGVAIVVAASLVIGAAVSAYQVAGHYSRQRALMDAVKRGDVATVRALLDSGVSARSGDKSFSAFEGALLLGRSAVVAAFVAHGADVNARGPSGSTPLELGIRGRNAQTVHLLLTHRADPNTRDPILLSTPLMEECSQLEPRIDIVRDLIEHGARVNVKNRFGNTALLIACGHHPALVQLLLSHGADANIRNSEGQSALTIVQEGLQIAKQKGWTDYETSDEATLRLLKQAGGRE